jgi:hypothetical protein
VKALLMLLCFGAFLFTGNLWSAVAVICLGLIPGAPAKPKDTTPVKEGPISRWMEASVQRRIARRVAEHERLHPTSDWSKRQGPLPFVADRPYGWRATPSDGSSVQF